MSAVRSAMPQARHNVSAPRHAAGDQLAATAALRRAPAPVFESDEDEFRVNLTDIPRASFCAEHMTVDGLQPTLFSRLLGLFAPKR